jgi:hypothetical protein
LILPTSARNDDDGTSSGDEAVPEDNGGQYPREIITGRKGNNNNNNNVVVYAHVLQSYDLGFPRGESGHTNQMTSFRPRRHNRRRK